MRLTLEAAANYEGQLDALRMHCYIVYRPLDGSPVLHHHLDKGQDSFDDIIEQLRKDGRR